MSVEKREGEERGQRLRSLLKLGLLLILVVGVPLYIVLFHKDILLRFRDYESIVKALRGYGIWSVLVYLGAQILQIVISVLPGQVFQFAAGSVFGFLPGLLLSVCGAALGTTVTYHLAKLLGTDAMHMIFGEERMQHLVSRLNSERAYVIVFLIYLIPGLPKDLACYAAGVSDMKFHPFLILSTVGRIPGMCGSLLFGYMFMQKNVAGMLVLGFALLVVLLFCVLFRKQIRRLVDKAYGKLSAMK